MLKVSDFVKISNNVNGNPRYIAGYQDFDATSVDDALAKCRAARLDVRKYRGKVYGGMIVLCTYSLSADVDMYNKLYPSADHAKLEFSELSQDAKDVLRLILCHAMTDSKYKYYTDALAELVKFYSSL